MSSKTVIALSAAIALASCAQKEQAKDQPQPAIQSSSAEVAVPGRGLAAAGVASAPGARMAGSLAEQQIADRVFFDTDRAELGDQSRRVVEAWAAWLRQNASATVLLEGHADERGTREYNLALGDRRARAAQAYLTSLGIEGRRLQAISYGKERPAVPGSSEQFWSQNRRAVIVIQP